MPESVSQPEESEKSELQWLAGTLPMAKYQKLEDLLKAKHWQDADQETYRLMITTVDKDEEQSLNHEDLQNFPCEDLLILDELWVKYSEGKWGFSVQERMWEECLGDELYPYNDKTEAQSDQFGDRVGWRKEGEWLSYESLALISSGELPHVNVLFGEHSSWGLYAFYRRFFQCDFVERYRKSIENEAPYSDLR